jgi:hypothetical protein
MDELCYDDGTPTLSGIGLPGMFPMSIGDRGPGVNWAMLTPDKLPVGAKEVTLQEAGIIS